MRKLTKLLGKFFDYEIFFWVIELWDFLIPLFGSQLTVYFMEILKISSFSVGDIERKYQKNLANFQFIFSLINDSIKSRVSP